jgi:hypothetical protein
VKSRGVRIGCASVLTAALLGAVGASVAAAAPGVGVIEVSSLSAGATAGTLHGRVLNATSKSRTAEVVVRLHRRGVPRHVLGRTNVFVPAGRRVAYSVKVKVPSGLPRGNYYISSCTLRGSVAGDYRCATAEDDVLIKGGTPIRGSGALASMASASAAAAETCSSGAHTLSKPGMRVYPEMGNGGYQSLHTDVYTVYDTAANLFLPGNHVELTQKSTQCLNDFSLDFERKNPNSDPLGPDMTVNSVLINGQPATFKFVQPTYPGDPNGQDDPDPLAHEAALTAPVSASNPNPPACNPPAEANNQCPANKLVITPAAPIPTGTQYVVTVNYTGRPGTHQDGDGSTEGWFRSCAAANCTGLPGDGSFVTTEPVGTMAWMPLNNHPSVKPTYDFYGTVTKGKVQLANGLRVSGPVDNAPDANFPGGSTSWHWRSPEPIASYLVENSIGTFDWSEGLAPVAGVLYYKAQSSAITATRKATNQAIMNQHEAITAFQAQFNGPFPFSSDGVIVGIPNAGFEEEMQTKITFANSGISLGTFHHENMHQWFGDNVAEADFNLTFWKEGFARLSEYYNTANGPATAAGGIGTPAGDAAFETSLIGRFNTNYAAGAASWASPPSNPTAANLFSTASTYNRPATAYIALWRILGKANFIAASKDIQTTYGGGSITEAQEIAVFHKHMPNQSADCSSRLDDFFKQWFDTAYPQGGLTKPSITGPGLNGTNFYNSEGGCTNGPSATVPAQLSLTLGTPATFGAFTPGLAKDYTAQTTANVISTAGDAMLSVSDPSTTAPGHLVNGTFSLPSALVASASSPGGTAAAGGSVGSGPLGLETWAAPISNDPVAIAFKQTIASTDALRTGTYSKTLTFTLSTTTP